MSIAFPKSHRHIVIVGGGLAGLFCALKLAPAARHHHHGRAARRRRIERLGAGRHRGGGRRRRHAGSACARHDRGRRRPRRRGGRARDGARGAGAHPRSARATACRSTGTSKAASRSRREAAHSARRIVHVRGDQAGTRHHGGAGRGRAQDADHPRARRLCRRGPDRATAHASTGARGARSPMAGSIAMPARAVVLATGGIGHLYAVTTNPHEARGQGLAIAARAGAIIADPEFVQFHPTAIDIGRDPAPLATEALRGEGATLVNRAGERFMLRDPSATPSLRRATSWRAACSPRSRPDAARSSMRARRSARRSPSAFPTRLRKLPSRRHRSGARPDPGRAGRALPHGRRRDRRARPHLARRPVGRRRSRLRPARTAPIASPRTRCSKPWSMRRASPRTSRPAGAAARHVPHARPKHARTAPIDRRGANARCAS